MDKQEAILFLQAYRPNGADDENAKFAEAFEIIQADPELQKWWQAQQGFDRAVAAKLAQVQIPDELRESILLGRPKIERIAPQPKLLPWLAIAAVVAVLCVAGTFFHVAKFGPLEQDDYAQAVIPLLNNNAPSLAMKTSDRDKITAWLKEQQAPMGTLPDKVAALAALGCQRYSVHGHTVSLICFQMANGDEAHLFIVDEDAIEDPPGTGTPEFHDENGWRMATWSDGKMTYLLATTSNADSLKQLL